MTTLNNNREYGRFVGSIVWPGNKAGYGVILGEEKFPEIGTQKYHSYLLAEIEEKCLDQLLNKYAEQAAQFNVNYLYGRNHQPSLQYLFIWNNERRKKGLPDLQYCYAPYSDNGNIEYQINILLKRLSPENKNLHLETSKMAGYMDIHPENISSATDSEYPAIAALGYAVSILELNPPFKDEDEYSWHKKLKRNSVTGY